MWKLYIHGGEITGRRSHSLPSLPWPCVCLSFLCLLPELGSESPARLRTCSLFQDPDANMWPHLAYWQASPAVVLAAARPVMWPSLLMGVLSQNRVSLRMWFRPRSPPARAHRSGRTGVPGGRGLQAAALMPTPDPFCKDPRFLWLESAPHVTSPSCAVGVSGALRHGAP